jgi:hypothetical protein
MHQSLTIHALRPSFAMTGSAFAMIVSASPSKKVATGAAESSVSFGKTSIKPVRKAHGYMLTDQWDLGVWANEIRSRVAADFRDWENSSNNFDKQVDRVIKALRPDDVAREKPPPSKL